MRVSCTTLVLFAVAATAIAATAAVAASQPPEVEIRGAYFAIKDTASRFSVRGVAYQPRYHGSIVDPITDAKHDAWTRDLDALQQLGANSLRVYDVDPKQPHDAFMQALAERQMYLILDLASAADPEAHVNRENPSYTVPLLQHYISVVNAFASYPNVLAFVVGNEVADASGSSTRAAPYVKALIRDLRMYMAATDTRMVPLGYAASDNAATRRPSMAYFACNEPADQDAAVDWYGSNLYSWCVGGNQTFETSGYQDRTRELSELGIPVLLSEFGCNVVRPRTWPDVGSIYGRDMNNVVSGAIAYEWTEESNSYGLVRIDADPNPIQTLPDYDNLKAAWARAPAPPTLPPASKTSTISDIKCPLVNDQWQASSAALPPTPSVCKCQEATAKAECRARSRNVTELASLLAQACARTDCSSLGARDDPPQGVYGELTMCSLEDKVAVALSKYYNEQKRDAAACNFNGAATLVDVTSTPNKDPCVDLIPSGSIQKKPRPKHGSVGTNDAVVFLGHLSNWIISVVFVMSTIII